MGCGASKRVDILTVDADSKSKTHKLSANVFSSGLNDFHKLKSFCQKHDIEQADVLVVFKRYLTSDESHLRNFHVSMLQVKEQFLVYSKLTQELADIFIPLMYFKDALRMSAPKSPLEVSFSRFLVISYLFGNQANSDLIFDFFCVLKKNFKLKATNMIFYHNFGQIIMLLSEELEKSSALRAIKIVMRNDPEDEEISIKNILRMGMKYPLLFYSLERFRRKVRRLVYGDKFWSNQQHLPPKIVFSDLGLGPNMLRFNNEESAIQQTAMSLISDALFTTSTCIRLSPNFYDNVDKIDDRDYQRLRDVFGYELSNGLIFESGLPVEKVIEPHSKLIFSTNTGMKSYDSLANNEVKDNEIERESAKQDVASTVDSILSSVSFSNLSSALRSMSFKATAAVQPAQTDEDEQKKVGSALELNDTVQSTVSTADGQAIEGDPLGREGGREEEGVLEDVEEDDDEDHYLNDDEDEEDDDDSDDDDYEDIRYKVPEGSESEFIVFDPITNRSFTYDPATGKNQWINQIISEDGEVIKEFL